MKSAARSAHVEQGTGFGVFLSPGAAVFDIIEKEIVMRFEHSYSAQELDLGVGMVCHPYNGHPMASQNLHYLTTSRSYEIMMMQGAWNREPDQEVLPRIGEGKDVVSGDPFPEYWKWDPYTGKKLEDPSLGGEFAKCPPAVFGFSIW